MAGVDMAAETAREPERAVVIAGDKQQLVAVIDEVAQHLRSCHGKLNLASQLFFLRTPARGQRGDFSPLAPCPVDVLLNIDACARRWTPPRHEPKLPIKCVAERRSM